ncbi:hypothetical protein AOQ84DRAFT_443880 [Glonium stellatum]|uniref:Uncharacterized protein n=1 Tax=Glonium stellatum TaxID=574774 RepID=A0A8E2JLL7_9PEZI|nr:hypothetical protein AOQ84DRAFT_443880 [Glonium stellatum]
MAQQRVLDRGRTEPAHTKSDSDSDSDDDGNGDDDRRLAEPITAEDNSTVIVPGYRAKVRNYSDSTSAKQFPSAPLYSTGETVYLVVPGKPQPAGPLLVVSIEVGNMYKLKWKESGAVLGQSASESSLVVPAG